MSAGCPPCQKCKDASRRLKTCGGRIAVFVFTTFVPLFPFGKGCAAVDDDRGAWCLPFRWLKARRPFLLPSSVASHPAAPVETPRPIVRLSARPLHRYARAGWVSTSQQSLWAATASPLLPFFVFGHKLRDASNKGRCASLKVAAVAVKHGDARTRPRAAPQIDCLNGGSARVRCWSQAAFSSLSSHLPRAARLFMRARCAKAR